MIWSKWLTKSENPNRDRWGINYIPEGSHPLDTGTVLVTFATRQDARDYLRSLKSVVAHPRSLSLCTVHPL